MVLATAAASFMSTVDYFPVSLSQALVLTLLVVVLSPVGDAAESFVKRSLGVKDMGAVMPGSWRARSTDSTVCSSWYRPLMFSFAPSGLL